MFWNILLIMFSETFTHYIFRYGLGRVGSEFYCLLRKIFLDFAHFTSQLTSKIFSFRKLVKKCSFPLSLPKKWKIVKNICLLWIQWNKSVLLTDAVFVIDINANTQNNKAFVFISELIYSMKNFYCWWF